jgi:hypothetical protein
MIHIPLALVMQFVISLQFNVWVGAAFAIGFFLSREITQTEYRNIEHNYGGKRANMPWYGGFEPRAWTVKGLLDWILPSVVVFALAFFIG